MFHRDNINGQNLKDKQLCLTFDDGPGIHTLPIASFLNKLNIRATFFVVGKYAADNINILVQLRELGHIVANHTFEHPDMPYYCSINGDVQDQINRTNAVIKPYVNSNLTYFRAPYGKWSTEVAEELNYNLKSSINMCGPIHWEIPGIDCHYWNIGKSVAEAVEAYLFEINKLGKGIVVMHDEIADMDIVKPKNKTFDLVKTLVPTLLEMGYHFVGLDEIEGLQKAEENLNTFYIKVKDSNYLTFLDNELYGSGNIQNKTIFKLIECSNGKVSITDPNNLFLSVNNEAKALTLTNIENEHTKFDYIPVRENAFFLRTFNGHYLNLIRNENMRIKADAQFMRQASIFEYEPVFMKIQKKVSLKAKFKMLKKSVLFIKSKLLSR